MGILLLAKFAAPVVGFVGLLGGLFLGVGMSAREVHLEGPHIEAVEGELGPQIEIDGQQFRMEVQEDGTVELIPVEPGDAELKKIEE